MVILSTVLRRCILGIQSIFGGIHGSIGIPRPVRMVRLFDVRKPVGRLFLEAVVIDLLRDHRRNQPAQHLDDEIVAR